MDLGLTGKSVIVLGAATPNNIGQEVARAFAKEGARVTVAGRRQEPLQALAAEIGGAWAICDITSKAQVDALVESTAAKFGAVDIGINTVGYGLMKPFLETTVEEIDQMSAVQYRGPILFFQALLRHMTHGGSIIQTSSATARIMLDDHAPYRGTKAATDEIIRSIANEFGERGIRANSVAPGLTDSPMAAGAYAVPAILDLFNKASPLGRTGHPKDVASACLWLASDQCFLTGEVLQVNGGVSLRRNPRGVEIYEAAMKAAGA